jgi:phospholipid/cholesterol/gamma-HCH transport system ATP-binding protein
MVNVNRHNTAAPDAPAESVVALKDVSIGFGDQRVLDGVTFEVPAGQTAVVLGRSGVGKSVLLKLIVALLCPDSGTVYFNGIDVNGIPETQLSDLRTNIGVVFQGAALFDSMTVFDNVAFGLRECRRGSDDEIREIVEARLDMVGMKGASDKMPSELSGGMKKRVSLARATAMEPELVLYDEPTTGLDPVTAAIIDDLIVRTRDSLGTTSIVVTHDMPSARRIGDRFLMLHSGDFVFDGDLEALDSCEEPVVCHFIQGQAEGARSGSSQG